MQDASDQTKPWEEYVQTAFNTGAAFNIVGNQTKSFLGQSSELPVLSVNSHFGVIDYEPTELVITARTGTPVNTLKQVLDAEGQMMPFEPPVFGDSDTLGGVMACGLSGPRRMYAGSARDYVLGVRLINGRGESLRFGGEVMKNVAGYDVSRLQIGAMGTLGLLLDVSMKVLPKPEVELTLVRENSVVNDTSPLVALARQPLPLSASAVLGKQCWIRLSGSKQSVDAAASELGGDTVSDGDAFWDSISSHQHPYFAGDGHLWRISVAEYAPELQLPGEWLYEWGGAQRWLVTDAPAMEVFSVCEKAGAHATRYRGDNEGAPCFQPLKNPMLQLHQRLRAAFDPAGLFNPGRFHPDF
ncbi:MAG: glycolate oxidase subunit GlcE [Gammaproteobacteria bacterium]|nr:glycolate oxidase subunit GlcE [Gammaproteobacteria bacterium]